nr:hypothetical protein CFP56_65250 [Quercus suber]
MVPGASRWFRCLVPDPAIRPVMIAIFFLVFQSESPDSMLRARKCRLRHVRCDEYRLLLEHVKVSKFRFNPISVAMTIPGAK